MKAIPVTIETTNNYKVSIGETITTRPANLEELEVTANGTYTAPEDSGYNPVIVNVQPNLQSKTATPTESVQTVSPDAGYYGLSEVEVGAISSTYVGSGITRQDSESIEDLLDPEGGALIPSGYYEEDAWFWVPEAYHSSPTVSINSAGLITASHTQAKGYVSTSRAGTETDTLQLSTQAAATINPTESEQTAVEAGRFTTGAVKVGAISNTYVGSGISRRTGSDVTVSGPDVSIPGGYYENPIIQSVTQVSAGTPRATKGTVSNNSISVTPSVTNTAGYITGGTKTGTAVTVSASELVSGTKSISANGTGIDVTNYASVDVAVPSSQPTLQTKSKTYTPTTSQQTETVVADNGYDGLEEVDITVNAVPPVEGWADIGSNDEFISVGSLRQWRLKPYFFVDSPGWIASDTPGEWKTYTAVPANTTITPSTQSQTVGGAKHMLESAITINAMPSGTAGTPTATKGTVSNHSVSVTPSVTNTTGYISGGTKTGTAVSVSASELVSGSETKTDNGTYDVTNLKTLVVNIPFVTYYTGSGAPSSSLGSNGDIYLRTS